KTPHTLHTALPYSSSPQLRGGVVPLRASGSSRVESSAVDFFLISLRHIRNLGTVSESLP
ncbi:hypothetical protein BIW11_06028, partial [Tropilaelaps mercedesae]